MSHPVESVASARREPVDIGMPTFYAPQGRDFARAWLIHHASRPSAWLGAATAVVFLCAFVGIVVAFGPELARP